MEVVVRQNTVSLIQAFRKAHSECLWESGKSNTAALKGMLMLVNAFLNHEKGGNALMIHEDLIPGGDKLGGERVQDLATGKKYVPFTMKEQFDLAVKALQSKQEQTIRLEVGQNAAGLAYIHDYMKNNGILGQDSTQGQALDAVAGLANGLTRYKHWAVTGVSLKDKSGKISHTSVFI